MKRGSVMTSKNIWLSFRESWAMRTSRCLHLAGKSSTYVSYIKQWYLVEGHIASLITNFGKRSSMSLRYHLHAQVQVSHWGITTTNASCNMRRNTSSVNNLRLWEAVAIMIITTTVVDNLLRATKWCYRLQAWWWDLPLTGLWSIHLVPNKLVHQVNSYPALLPRYSNSFHSIRMLR